MNDFSLTRIPNHNLFGLLFPPLLDISEYEIEIIHPEYIADTYITGVGTLTSDITRQCAIVDCNKFDYVLIPSESSNSTYFYSGMRPSYDSGAINGVYTVIKEIGVDAVAWGLLTTDRPYACINVKKGDNLPIIGFKRTRSDNVNPKSPAKEPEVEEEPVEEPVEKTVKRSTKK